ncbi:MAG: S49 family peptidase, partial [Pseudomonadota bacterium]
PTARDRLEALIDDSYRHFTELVAQRRKLAPDELDLAARGRVFTANQAYAHRLVDSTGGWHDVKDQLRMLGGAPSDQPVRFILPESPDLWMRVVQGVANFDPGMIRDVDRLERMLGSGERIQALMPFFEIRQ